MRITHRTFVAGALALLAALPLAACSDDESSGTSSTTTTERATTSTTAADGGEDGEVITRSGPVTIAVGERATIRLEGNVTTGYSWTISEQPDPAVVKVVSDEYVAPGEGAAVGQGGHQEVVVEGVAAGTTSLGMSYARPWEQDTPPAETATFDITVR
jgi:predicted secreted protein